MKLDTASILQPTRLDCSAIVLVEDGIWLHAVYRHFRQAAKCVHCVARYYARSKKTTRPQQAAACSMMCNHLGKGKDYILDIAFRYLKAERAL